MKMLYVSFVILLLSAACSAQSVPLLHQARFRAVASPEVLDCMGSTRLASLIRAPERLPELDQRSSLRGTQEVERVLAETLALPQALMPAVFGSIAKSNSVTSVCLSDGRLFLWRNMGDVDALAMVPLKGTPHRQGSGRTLKVWLCATGDKAASEWQQQPEGDEINAWLRVRLQMLAGSSVRLQDAHRKEQGIKKMQGVLGTDRAERPASLSVSQRLLAIEIPLDADDLNDAYAPTPVPLEPTHIPKRPIVAPADWPPKGNHAARD